MKKVIYYFSFFGGIIVTMLGLIIMLIENDTNMRPHRLIDFNLILIFIVGALVFLYIIINKGIR